MFSNAGIDLSQLIVPLQSVGKILPVDEQPFTFFTLVQDFGFDHVHPIFVHFPISIGIFGTLVYFLTYFFKSNDKGWQFFSFFILFFAAIAAGCTLATGAMYTFNLTGDPNTATTWHQNMAILTVFLFGLGVFLQILSFILKQNIFYCKTLCLFIYGFACISVMVTGFIGGSIVYDFLLNPSLVGGTGA